MTSQPKHRNTNKYGIQHLILLFLVLAAIVTGIFYFSNASQAARNPQESVDAAYGAYVAAYTAGVISKESAIRVRFAEEFQESVVAGKEAADNLFKISPAVSGKAYWTDSKTIEFKPDQLLTSGRQYQVAFKLGQIMEVPDELSVFEFNFQTLDQNFEVNIEGFAIYDKTNLQRQKLVGNLVTADMADPAQVQKILSAAQGDKNLKITWDHSTDQKNHNFILEDVLRSDNTSELEIKWDGSSLDVSKTGGQVIQVPAIGDFKLLSAKVIHNPEQYVSLQFSDPLLQKQNLNGLITVADLNNLRFLIEDNEIRVYPSVRQTGKKTLQLFAGIKNVQNYKMKKGTSLEVAFEQLKPAVKLVGKGVILPSTDGLVMPFEAVSLKAVQVQVTKVYESNIAQFLQVNNLQGDREIRRVGRPLLKKTIALNNQGVTDLGKWNRFTLDLSQLISSEPGAIYQVQLSFDQKHAAFNCPGQDSAGEGLTSIEEDSWDNPEEDEFSYWDTYQDYYYDPEYRWEERDNPCHSSYYAYGRRAVTKNLMASNLGLTAKLGNNKQLVVAVTDMQTTVPLSGVTVEIYDYQQQLIENTFTDTEGFVKVDLRKKPYLIIAKNKDERGYLKVDDGNALSLSSFDVSGQVVEKGIKGFIYGERGVWRPGDDIFLTFILEDKNDQLPDKHPVIFELRNPKGQIKQKLVKTASIGNMYHFATKTAVDDPTGNWQATVQVGGATFRKSLKIETIKPNRLKINLDFGTDKIKAGQQNLAGQLHVNWLHGAPARNLKAEFDVVLQGATTTFPKYAEYAFDDPARDFYSESQKIFEGVLDADGHAIINAALSPENAAPGMLMAHFKGKVFEGGGGFSIDRFSIPYYPYTSFVGLRTPKGDKARGMLLTDTTHVVDIVTVDADGQPVSRSGVEVSLYKLEWRWWWDQSTQNISNYIGRSHNIPLEKASINTKNGQGSWKFKVKYPEWGRFFIRVCDPVSGHCAGKVIYLDWPGWAGRGQREFPGAATMLSFSADKDKYKVGEDVKISIPTSENGRALVSIENGSGVIDQQWIETQKGETPFLFAVTEEMAPNIYVHISLMQPHAQTVNDLPIRLYGILPVTIDNPDTHLDPVIDMAAELEPEQEVTIKISESNGKPMAYTVAVVDEGLLDLTKFKTPDAWKSFYAREALGVKTWDVFEDVIGAYGGNLERILAVGGDESGGQEENTKVNRFKPVVKYMGPFYLEPSQKATHTFTMPQYIGSVKTMVIAAHEGAYGKAEAVTPVRQSLMVLGTLPRVLGPGETVSLPANVFVSDQSIKNVAVHLETNDQFSFNGSSSKNLNFNGPSDQLVDFSLLVKPQLGSGKVTVNAKSGSKSAVHNIEIEVRNPNPPVVEVMEKVIPAGGSWETEFKNVGMAGTNSGMLELYSIPPINLEKRLRYLLRYPHGCIEQTVSSAFPQLFLADVMDMNETSLQMIQKNVTAAIVKLQSFQNSDGGFSYWPGQSDYDAWSTSYVGQFLIEAQQKGYVVPHELLRKWKQFQRSAARKWRKNSSRYQSDLIQAYRLYTLALGESPEKGAMNRLRERSDLSNVAKWQLAAAYHLAGQAEAAKQLVKNVTTTVQPYRQSSYTYGSSVRDEALILETLSLMGEKEKGFALMKMIADRLNSNNHWMSTQTTAFCLIAATKFIQLEKPKGGISFTFTLNDQPQESGKTDLAIAQKSLSIDNRPNGQIKVTNTSQQQLYARLILEGTPETGDQTQAENNMRLAVIYKDMDGKLIDPATIEQGTNFISEVTVSNPGLRGDYRELALTQIFPSGWEIINNRLDDTDYPGDKDQPQYQDIRDDRVYTYFSLGANKRKTFRIMLNASYTGRFYLPTIYCEAMYDNTINARKPGKWVMVKKAGVQ
ncbi:MG2 domain-containing protein [Fulvivirgaceae bacterium BMA12]|uniref:MG2 domain-containing protein n=1 Tax=Agaribacillus aureus TaxID=3051825 RepID=A0ABT8L944_9BACT|nr:MG2 domain-containing protein [Fulvivirgaceae bacterium BMA12]